MSRKHIPSNFARKPRSLKELERWKATEFRLFLLYTGRILLKGILAENKYNNFLKLSVAMLILLSPTLVTSHHETAEQLLQQFVEEAVSEELYGESWMVYNVHTLLHLTAEARLYGSLNSCNGFPFENYLQTIKRLVRNGNNVTMQLCNRITELEDIDHTPKERSNSPSLKSPNNVYVNLEQKICYIVQDRCQAGYICRRYAHPVAAFTTPLLSSVVGILVFSKKRTRMVRRVRGLLGSKAVIVKSTTESIVVQQLLDTI